MAEGGKVLHHLPHPVGAVHQDGWHVLDSPIQQDESSLASHLP